MNNEGHVKCLARDCTYVWKTQASMRDRSNHLRGTYGFGPARLTDHAIILAMNKQKKCPKCLYTVDYNQSIKYLYEHERVKHQSQDTARIEGFVVLSRTGLLEPDVVRLAEKSVHQRLLQTIMACDFYHGRSGLAAFWGIEGKDDKTSMEAIEQKITTTNKNMGRPPWHPMRPDEFLSDEPLSLDLSTEDYIRQMDFNWSGKRASLKEMYDVGKI